MPVKQYDSVAWYCPKCRNAHPREDPFVWVERTQWCLPHAEMTSLLSFAVWREQPL